MTADQVEEILGPEGAAKVRAIAIEHGPLTEAQIAVLVPLLEAPAAAERRQAA